MTLKEKLTEDMKTTMKAKDRERLSVVQLVRAAILQVEKDKQIAVDDPGVLEIIAREVRQRNEAIEEYKKFDAQPAIEKLNREVGILREYLPQQLSLEEIRQMVAGAVEQTKAAGPRDMGKVMGVLMPKVRGRADGKVVNQLVKEALGQ
ncbi:MAG: GatB/YqeY domain-containing protein [Bacillota bacterium]|nr:GatB/YqeY domain-containing protein [Bacillota bacterium]